MNIIISELRADHHHIVKILKLIKYLLGPLKDNHRTENITLLGECLEYMSVYPDTVHHPKEDLIFKKLIERDNTDSVYVESLQKEHQILFEKCHELSNMITKVIQDPVASLEQLVDKSLKYIDMQIRHMRIEEATVFPLVENALGIEDWKYIIRNMPEREDPIFSGKRNHYQTIRKELVNLESELVH